MYVHQHQAKGWEIFYLTEQFVSFGLPEYSLRTAHGTYLSALDDNAMTQASEPQHLEHFRVNRSAANPNIFTLQCHKQ
jgi:hypothetical protein